MTVTALLHHMDRINIRIWDIISFFSVFLIYNINKAYFERSEIISVKLLSSSDMFSLDEFLK